MSNKNSIISVAFCLVLPTFVACAVLFAPVNPPGILIAACALSPLAAAFFGHAARREISKSGQDGAGGSTMAAAGLTVGYLEIAFVSLILISSVHHPNRMVAHEASAVGSMRTLNRAAGAYAGTHPQEGFPKALKDLSMNGPQPEPDWLIDQALASGVRAHYRFTYIPRSTKSDGVIDAYQILADPIDSRDQESRHFFTDQSGSIRMSKGAPANESSTELK
jgi:hypothetical protein